MEHEISERISRIHIQLSGKAQVVTLRVLRKHWSCRSCHIYLFELDLYIFMSHLDLSAKALSYSGPLSMRQKFSKNELITTLINMNVVYEVAYSLALVPFFFSLVWHLSHLPSFILTWLLAAHILVKLFCGTTEAVKRRLFKEHHYLPQLIR